MILRDFYTGGFPIRNTAPVLCFSKDGEVSVAYDSSSLSHLISSKEIYQIIGVWPGKKNTDCFLLSKEHYGNLKPPKGHELVDQAKKIVLIYVKGIFSKVVYSVEGKEGIFDSGDKALADYIITAGLQHKVVERNSWEK
jgi:hypothetical protein